MSAERQVGWWVIGVMALIGGCFILSTVGEEWSAIGIGDTAHTLADEAWPAAVRLEEARSGLWRVGNVLDDYHETPTPELARQLADARELLATSWNAFEQHPPPDVSPALILAAQAERITMARAVDHVVQLANAGRLQEADEAFHREADPLMDRLDGSLFALASLNAHAGATAADRVRELRRRSLVFTLMLDLLCLIIVGVAGWVMLGATRRRVGRLERRADEFEAFAGRVAHDLRNPLASIDLLLHAAARTSRNPAVEEQLARASKAIRSAHVLTEDLLRFARAGGRPDPTRRTDVDAIVPQILSELTPGAQDSGVELVLERADPVRAVCTRGVLASIVSNLVGNAIKFMESSTERRVTVRVIDLGRAARIEVEDTGPGLPAHVISSCFQPFVRGEGPAAGHGLGLATVKRLTEAHGGRVGFFTGPRGTLFFVVLPAEPLSASASTPDDSASAAIAQ